MTKYFDEDDPLLCPDCGSERIEIRVLTWIELDTRERSRVGGGYEYDGDSAALCRSCRWEGDGGDLVAQWDDDTEDQTGDGAADGGGL